MERFWAKKIPRLVFQYWDPRVHWFEFDSNKLSILRISPLIHFTKGALADLIANLIDRANVRTTCKTSTCVNGGLMNYGIL